MITSIAHRINRSELRTLSRIHHIRGVRMNEIWMANASYEGKNHTPILSLYLCCNSCYDSHFAGLTFAYYLIVRQPFVHILCIYIHTVFMASGKIHSRLQLTLTSFNPSPIYKRTFIFVLFFVFSSFYSGKSWWFHISSSIFGKFGCMNAGREYGAQLLTTSGALWLRTRKLMLIKEKNCIKTHFGLFYNTILVFMFTMEWMKSA